MTAKDSKDSKEIINDINNVVFSVIDNKSVAKSIFAKLMESYDNGCTEDELYKEMKGLLNK